jgi:hypothetical protein
LHQGVIFPLFQDHFSASATGLSETQLLTLYGWDFNGLLLGWYRLVRRGPSGRDYTSPEKLLRELSAEHPAEVIAEWRVDPVTQKGDWVEAWVLQTVDVHVDQQNKRGLVIVQEAFIYGSTLNRSGIVIMWNSSLGQLPNSPSRQGKNYTHSCGNERTNLFPVLRFVVCSTTGSIVYLLSHHLKFLSIVT